MADKELVKLEDIWVHYDGAPILEGVSLSVEQGDFLGIIGPNGGGKTTLLKVILGLVAPSRGRMSVLGKPPERSRNSIGYVPQRNLFDIDFPISVWDVVLMGRYGRVGLFRRYSREDKRAVEGALQTVGMLDFRGRQIGKLSGGEQQKVFIARAMVAEPKLLLLDEPAAGMNPQETRELDELILQIRDSRDLTVLLIEHDMNIVMRLSERILVMDYGKLIAKGSPDEIRRDPVVITAYLGEDSDARA